MGFKRELTRFKNRIKYENTKIRLNSHRKKTQMPAGLSVLPINRLPMTLRDDTEYEFYAKQMLSEAGNTGDILNQSLKCYCVCHSITNTDRPNTPIFHSGDCLQDCGENNDQYRYYLSCKLRALQK